MSRRHRGGATSSASTPWLIGGYLYGARVASGRCAKAYALLMVLVLTVMPPGLLIVFLLLPSILGWSRRPGLLMLLTGVAGVVLLMFPLLGAVLVFGSGRRAYMPSSRDALLVVRAVGGRWRVENFFAAHPKKSNTAPLWDCAVPALLEVADRSGVVIEATAVNEAVARYYRRRLPGLRDVGRLPMGRVRLERPPSGAPARSRRSGAEGCSPRSSERH